MFRGLLAPLVLAIGACQALLALDGPDGGANAPGSDASATDGSVTADGAVAEGSTSSETGDGANGDGAAGPFCERRRLEDPRPQLCDDFDDLNLGLGAGWSTDAAVNGKGGVLGFDDGGFDGSPRGIVVTANTACAQCYGQLIDETTMTPATITVEARVRVVSTPPTTVVQMFGTEIETQAGYYRLDLVYRANHFWIVENNTGSTSDHGDAVRAPGNGYLHVRVMFGFVEARVRMWIEGVKVIDEPIAPPVPSQSKSRVEVGLYMEQSQPATELHYDNVLYELVPR